MELPINLLNTTIFALIFLLIFYVCLCIYAKRTLVPNYKQLFLYVTLFSLFGVVGEVLVNTSYQIVLGTPLWEYRLFPAHHGNICYYFLFVWGSLGFYKYFTDSLFIKKETSEFKLGLLMGSEAIFLELLYNGLFYLCFGEFIFYYLPANLGPLSHFSCIQVIPFYFMVGFALTKLIKAHAAIPFSKTLFAFYWMTIITFVFFT